MIGAFIDNYNCAIKLNYVIPEDSGNWTCVLEEWNDGYFRGYGKRVTGHWDVVILPKNLDTIISSSEPSSVRFFSTTNVIFLAIPSIIIILLLFIMAYKMYFESTTSDVDKNENDLIQMPDDIKEEHS